MSALASGLYEGWVRHRRILPKVHHFRYPLFMMYLDLQELPELFQTSPLFSSKVWAPVRFCREDFLGSGQVPLDEAVRQVVRQELGTCPSGPIRMLTQVRYLGLSFNPVSFYYVFEEDGKQLGAVVAEITNTPWGERHRYVFRAKGGQVNRYRFAKAFHVSPFFGMDMDYQWHFPVPGEKLTVHMRNLQKKTRLFDATLHLRRREFKGATLNALIFKYPWISLMVLLRIYMQAARLRLKGMPFNTHPKKLKPPEVSGEIL